MNIHAIKSYTQLPQARQDAIAFVMAHYTESTFRINNNHLEVGYYNNYRWEVLIGGDERYWASRYRNECSDAAGNCGLGPHPFNPDSPRIEWP